MRKEVTHEGLVVNLRAARRRQAMHEQRTRHLREVARAVGMSKNSTLGAKAISEIQPPQDERGAA